MRAGREEQRADQQEKQSFHSSTPFTIMLLLLKYANNTHSCLLTTIRAKTTSWHNNDLSLSLLF